MQWEEQSARIPLERKEFKTRKLGFEDDLCCLLESHFICWTVISSPVTADTNTDGCSKDW